MTEQLLNEFNNNPVIADTVANLTSVLFELDPMQQYCRENSLYDEYKKEAEMITFALVTHTHPPAVERKQAVIKAVFEMQYAPLNISDEDAATIAARI